MYSVPFEWGAGHVHVCLAHGPGGYRRRPMFRHCGLPELSSSDRGKFRAYVGIHALLHSLYHRPSLI